MEDEYYISTDSSDLSDSSNDSDSDQEDKIYPTSNINYRQAIHNMIYDYGLSDHISVDDLFKKKRLCKNYTSNCEILAPCCDKYYCCCKCHDSIENHTIVRNEVTKIMCTMCKTKQDVSNICVNCNITFGDYVCLICMVFDTSGKIITHCEKCNICWVMRDEDTLIHCDRCKCCMPSKVFADHICTDDKLNNCPICCDTLKSIKEIQLMCCGHAIHTECLNDYIKHGYKCPICKKTIVDMVEKFKELDKEIYETPIPEDLHINVETFCNDCQKSCSALFHYIGIKCKHCGSYNTQKK
jgi:RING finger/CHY zinc finger protein 1